MALRIEHIDSIARKKTRGVLYVVFDDPRRLLASISKDENSQGEKDILVIGIIIRNGKRWRPGWVAVVSAWTPCGGIADERWIHEYRGQIYVDVPYDDQQPDCQALLDYLEDKEGNPRVPGAFLCFLPLDVAMKNAHHDAPGFWERWADEF